MNIERIEQILTEAVEEWLKDPEHALTQNLYQAEIDGKECRCLIGCFSPKRTPGKVIEFRDVAGEALSIDPDILWALIDGFDNTPRNASSDETLTSLYALGQRMRERYKDRIVV